MAKRKIPPHWERLLRGSALVLAVKVLGALSGYAFVFLLVREYGKEGYGSFELAFTILSLASALNRWGWDGIVVREVLARKGKKKKQNAVVTAAFSFVLATGVVLSAALYWGAPLLGKLFHSEQLPLHLSVVAVLLIPWGWFQLRSDVFRAKNNLLAYGLWQYGSITLLASILLFLVPVDASVYSPVTLLLLVLLPFLAWNLWKLRASAASVSLQEQRAEWKLALPGATSMLVSSLLYLVLSWSDTLMIGYFLDESAVGLYRVSFKVATLIVFAQFAVNAQAAPDIARYWAQGNRELLQNAVTRIAWINTVVALPAFLVLTLAAPWFLGFFGADFTAQAGTLRWLALGQLTNALCGPVMYLLNMTGHEKSARNTMAVGVVVNLVGNAVLIPTVGIAGAAIATSFTMALWNGWAMVAVYRKTGIRTFLFWR
ncbi:MAG: oligosaccharide flippase family protein [Schleiferiaceae bacterium]|jgi:O-antigen/teichoic acid export membrane protein|nr:oligosaccharide flippase family protein [Schleiferiaceae bacterium]MDP4627580.1 oligosaccharide flippase family protein [Schleiferiaceae bacterium]MDP4728341.1 oligosaccharide flippase family protein [Schleiferiaceae bacterium]MDP4750156.1 oligosaccharide flippase family protein [Schleiferiaceae bacterium]MDP4858667.1 oligosaccharide flippase family protein [Schleiferiaceae bacterium]